MAWNERSWAARHDELGDQAEAVYEAVFPKHSRLGLRRPPFAVAGMDPLLRNVPDYLERDRFVEVKGTGRDNTVKIRVDTLHALPQWEMIAPVDVFVWNSHTERWYRASFREVYKAILAHGKHGVFHDGNEYMGLKLAHFPSEPTPFDPSEVPNAEAA